MAAAAFSVDDYFARLRLNPSELDVAPTLSKLQKIQEAHLANVPFENTAQHGVLLDGPVRLDVEQAAHKILRRNRGGFCFELNGLLAVFLDQLGYRVTRVPARVCANGSYPPEPTHLVLIVETSSKDKYFVDVGFGEPPLHPLRYDLLSGEQQVTPEGMQSRLSRKGTIIGEDMNGVSSEDDVVELFWKQPGSDNWHPRLEWNYQASMVDQGLELIDFSDALKLVQAEESIFSQKLIVCLLTRERKVVLAGDRLRVTGPPRFPQKDAKAMNDLQLVEPPRTITPIETEDQARNILRDVFGQPLASTEGLKLSKSKSSDPAVWSQM